MLAVGIVINVYFMVFGVAPRLRDAGMSGWLALLMLVPILGWLWAIFVLFVPTGYVPPNHLDRVIRQ